MASETNELTFVRCPACRSLVPAAATRCRICNNPLEGESSAKSDDSDAARNASRVRQKTITATPDDVAAALMSAQGKSTAPSEPAAIAGTTASAAVVDNDDDDFDPLSAFLEEIEDVSTTPVAAVEPAASAAGAIDDHDDDLGFDLFDEPEAIAPAVSTTKAPAASAGSGTASRSVSPAQKAAAPSKPVYDVAAEEEDISFESVGVDEPLQAAVATQSVVKEPPAAQSAPMREEVRRDVPRQQAAQPKRPQQNAQSSGPQANSQRAAASAPAKQQQQQPRAQSDRPQQERRPQPQAQAQARDSQAAQRRDGGREQQQPQQRHGAGVSQPERRHDDRRHDERRHDDRRRDEQRPEPSPQAVASERGPKTGKMRPGRLFGWFVSYENPDGRAIELREGKFFVTGSSIRPSDLILEDPSISTPHALMAVSADGGMVIQDLMSDRGIFVRPSSGGGYRREEGTARIEHGDWVRFGDVEFLVIIVPHESRR
jgi:hypothetical protein